MILLTNSDMRTVGNIKAKETRQPAIMRATCNEKRFAIKYNSVHSQESITR